jgi:hypothetical protein
MWGALPGPEWEEGPSGAVRGPRRGPAGLATPERSPGPGLGGLKQLERARESPWAQRASTEPTSAGRERAADA